jgi:hypothetical protein
MVETASSLEEGEGTKLIRNGRSVEELRTDADQYRRRLQLKALVASLPDD